MTETVEERWFRWDVAMNEGNFEDIVREFDNMIVKQVRIVVGDMIRRDECLEELGIISLSPNAMFKRKENGKFKR
jgi:hypothetical protein